MNTQDTPSPTSTPHTFFNVVKNTCLMPVTSTLFCGAVLHEDRYNCFHGIDSSDGPSREAEEVIERGVELISCSHEKDLVRILALTETSPNITLSIAEVLCEENSIIMRKTLDRNSLGHGATAPVVLSIWVLG